MLITDKEGLKAFYSNNRVWQLVPTVERTKKGRLFCTFYSGQESETLGNYCVILKSDDDGFVWSEPIAAAYDGEMHRCFDPVVWLDPKDRLWFTWSRGHEDGVYATVCDDPDADELTWSKEFFVGKNVMMNKPTVLSSGEWLFPIALWSYWYINDTLKQKRAYDELYTKEYFGGEEHLSGANLYRTVDNGKTFNLLGGCRNIQNRSIEEHMIYEKENGVLVMFIRTNEGIARSFSYDRGKTWTDAYKFLDGPSSRFCVMKLRSGRVLLVNHFDFNERNNLTAFLSEDDGETFPHKLLLDERDEVSYPSATEGEDGYIYIVYDRERGGYKTSLAEAQSCAREILLAKINESDIIAGDMLSKDGRLKQTVSKLGEYTGDKNLFTKYPKTDKKEFIEAVLKYTDEKKLLSTLFVFFEPSFLNMSLSQTEKIDLLIEKIKADKKNLKILLPKAVEVLVKIPPAEDSDKKRKLSSLMLDRLKSDFSLSEFAKEQGISRHYLGHLFEKTTGFELDTYKGIHRMKKAKEMLISTNLSLGEICKSCDFANENDLSNEFMQDVGITPEEYRKYNKKLKEKEVLLCQE